MGNEVQGVTKQRWKTNKKKNKLKRLKNRFQFKINLNAQPYLEPNKSQPSTPPSEEQRTTHPKLDPPKESATSEMPGSQGERSFISSSELPAAPHAPRPIPKVPLIMYSQAAVILTRHPLCPCHGKHKDILRLTRAVSVCQVYREFKLMLPQKWNKHTLCFDSHFLFQCCPANFRAKLSHMNPH